MTKATDRYRASSCEGKHRFLTWEEAGRVAKQDRKVKRYPYHCCFCSGYHLGTKDIPKKHKRPDRPLEVE